MGAMRGATSRGVRVLASCAVAALVAIAARGDGAATRTRAQAPPPLVFDCHLDATCPEVSIAGDPRAVIPNFGPAPFRGYGDPSIERDPATGTLWLAYSWLDVLFAPNMGPPPVIDLGVRTHLARSDDGGASFSFVRALNATLPATHPDTGVQGWSIHEVPTLLYAGPASWQLMTLDYFDPYGEAPPPAPEDRRDFYYARSLAATPAALGDASTPWVRGYQTSPSFGAMYNLSALIPELADCAVFTEPALFAKDGVTYLATNCVVFDASGRRDDLERLVLLREQAGGYAYVGALLTHADAMDFGGSRVEQADLAFSASGAVLLIATPIRDAAPNHLGCYVFEVADIASAQVRRDAGGHAVPLAHITGNEDTALGPGLCTYDAASQTGVIITLHRFTASPFDMDFTMRATGVHPDVAPACAGADSDGDGVPDACDNCPSAANASQANSDNEIDNGPGIASRDVTVPDAAADGEGDACETGGDIDNDGLPDAQDTEPLTGAGLCGTLVSSDGHPSPAGGDITDADGNGPSWDTDGDGVLDGVECALGTNPRDAGSKPTAVQCANFHTGGVGPNTAMTDADGDGLPAATEYCKWGTEDDPAFAGAAHAQDSDGDGLRDCIEANDTDGNRVQNFTGDTINSAKAALGIIGKTMDFDLDGNGNVNFTGDTILSAKMALHVGGLCPP